MLARLRCAAPRAEASGRGDLSPSRGRAGWGSYTTGTDGHAAAGVKVRSRVVADPPLPLSALERTVC